MKTYEPLIGEYIRKTCNMLVQMAAEDNEMVQAVFNGVTITAKPCMTAGDLEQGWQEEQERQCSEYVLSPEYAKEHREMEMRKKREDALRQDMLSAAGPMEFSDEDAWKLFAKDNTDAYGAGVLRYAETWARLMQTRIANGEAIDMCADELSHVADDGITGFMYGCAVSVLANTWKHGEELRQWHNLKTQLGENTHGEISESH